MIFKTIILLVPLILLRKNSILRVLNLLLVLILIAAII